MKKLALTIAIVLGICVCSFAQQEGGGMFGYGKVDKEEEIKHSFIDRDGLFSLPQLPEFNSEEDQPAPLGSGALVLAGLGAAYLAAKKRKED